VTGATPATCDAWRLDGAKLLLRVDESEPVSLKTLLASAQAIKESSARLPMFLEPLPVTKNEKGYTVVKNARPWHAWPTWRRARRQQPLPVAETAILRSVRNGPFHHAAHPVARRRIGR
jgi:hypothetical protein